MIETEAASQQQLLVIDSHHDVGVRTQKNNNDKCNSALAQEKFME